MKRTHINIGIIALVTGIFLLEYYLISSYIKEIFQYTLIEVRNDAINNEIEQFKMYLIENFVFLSLQSVGMFLCLNIGFLYFKIKTSFKKILNLIIFSLLSVVVNQFLIILIIKLNNWTFTTGSINTAYEKLNLANYINIEKTVPWIKLSLTSSNLGQFLILILLGISIHKIIKIKYNRAFSLALRTYGLGILLWFVFAMVMEMNFG